MSWDKKNTFSYVLLYNNTETMCILQDIFSPVTKFEGGQ